MNESLESKMSNFFVANLRNSWLLRAIRASLLRLLLVNLNILALNLFRPELIRGSLKDICLHHLLLPVIHHPAHYG